MASLDFQLCSEMSKNVEVLTTSGKKELDQGLMKKIKKICKMSNEYVKHLYYLAMTQLNKGHSEIRYGAVLLINEIFIRSHEFRELLLAEFQDFLELSVETDPDMPLPPPKAAAKDLKIKTLQFIQEWNAKFGKDYKRLNLGYKYLKHCKKVDFDDAQSRSIVQRQREQEEQRRRDRNAAGKVEKAKQEILERTEEISSILTQVENCFRILLPHPEEFFTEYDFIMPSTSRTVSFSQNTLGNTALNDSEVNNSAVDNASQETVVAANSNVSEALRHHGLHDRKYNLTIHIDKESLSVIEENEDTAPVIENLRDFHGQIVSQYLPLISKWIKVFTAGSDCTDSLKKAIDLKQMLESSVSKFKELKITAKSMRKAASPDGEDDSEEDEFEEVEEKEGYEPVIPVHKRKEYGVDTDSKIPTDTHAHSKQLQKKEKPSLWNLMSHEESAIEDPTSRLSTLNALCKKYKDELNRTESLNASGEASTSGQLKENMEEDSENSRKQKLLSQAPVLPFDIDLYHWEDEKLEAPVVRQFSDLHCVWQLRSENDLHAVHSEESTAALRRRYIDFSGKFVPVKWSCRVPLPSGKLCPRKDRYKCPLHGPIVARDELGNPVNSEDQKTKKLDEPSTSQESVPEWQDPELLRDIEAATGIDLKLPAKRKSKGKSPKVKSKKKPQYPGLTDVKKVENTVRKRLEKKVLNKHTVKKVSATLDALDEKRFLDKYGNQWNYAFQT